MAFNLAFNSMHDHMFLPIGIACMRELMPSLNQPGRTGIPYSNPLVIIGGGDVKGVTTCDITLYIYDSSKNSWRKVNSLMHKQEIAHGIL